MNYAERAESYRNKAEEIRAVASSMLDKDAQILMRKIAVDYLHMARTLDRIAAQKARLGSRS